MFTRFLIFTACLAAVGFLAFAYVEIPPGRFDVVDWAHAAVNATTIRPGDSQDYNVRVTDRRLEIASRVRQEEGARAFGHAPSGQMKRIVLLPSGTPEAPRTAREICRFLLKSGFVSTIETQFPSIAKTDGHQITLEATTNQGANGVVSAIDFSFQYTGFIRQGDPRKIADYAEAMVRKEVNARCWADAGFDPHPPRIPDTSETAVITDLPGEPDTAAAQKRIFFGDSSDSLKDMPPGNPTSPPAPTSVARVAAPVASDVNRSTISTAISPSPAGQISIQAASGEAYAGERQNRIDDMERQLKDIEFDIHELNESHGDAWGRHYDAGGKSHPNSVGISKQDRLAFLRKKREEALVKINKLKSGVPVNSVDSAPSTGIDSLKDVPRL